MQEPNAFRLLMINVNIDGIDALLGDVEDDIVLRWPASGRRRDCPAER